MNVRADKYQLSIKDAERKVFPPRVVRGTPSQTESQQWLGNMECIQPVSGIL